MSKTEKLAKQLLDLGIDDVRELQTILEQKGFLLGITIVPDSWLRENGVKFSQHSLHTDAATLSTSEDQRDNAAPVS